MGKKSLRFDKSNIQLKTTEEATQSILNGVLHPKRWLTVLQFFILCTSVC